MSSESDSRVPSGSTIEASGRLFFRFTPQGTAMLSQKVSVTMPHIFLDDTDLVVQIGNNVRPLSFEI